MFETIALRNRISTSDSGAFKIVEIYEHFVKKYAKEIEYAAPYKISVEEAQERKDYYDDDGIFHPSWIYTEYDDDGDSVTQEECWEELEQEYEYAMRKKHLPIIVPIVSGDKECYVMPKAKTYYEFNESTKGKKYSKLREKRIKIAVIGKINKLGGKLMINQMYNAERIIELGIAAGFNDKKIINNLFWFFVEDAHACLLQDMHRNNLGVYKGNIVTFDMGQISDNRHSIRKFYKRDLNQLKYKLKSKLEKNSKKVT